MFDSAAGGRILQLPRSKVQRHLVTIKCGVSFFTPQAQAKTTRSIQIKDYKCAIVEAPFPCSTCRSRTPSFSHLHFPASHFPFRGQFSTTQSNRIDLQLPKETCALKLCPPCVCVSSVTSTGNCCKNKRPSSLGHLLNSASGH